MRIQESSRVITILICILACIGIGSMLYSYRLVSQQEQTITKLLMASEAIEKLVYGSDVLTTAIRGYAATSDKHYKNDFQVELSVTRD